MLSQLSRFLFFSPTSAKTITPLATYNSVFFSSLGAYHRILHSFASRRFLPCLNPSNPRGSTNDVNTPPPLPSRKNRKDAHTHKNPAKLIFASSTNFCRLVTNHMTKKHPHLDQSAIEPLEIPQKGIPLRRLLPARNGASPCGAWSGEPSLTTYATFARKVFSLSKWCLAEIASSLDHRIRTVLMDDWCSAAVGRHRGTLVCPHP
ncbi:hypothetical protein V8C35DRAFT_310431 [Trichoderma chlorosporum]